MPLHAERTRRWARFIVGGAANTLFSYAAYFGLCLLIDYQVAYLIAYASGIIFSYYMNVLYVFKTSTSLKSFLKFPIVYIVQYLCSALILGFLVVDLSISKFYAPIIVTAITLPLTYILSKLTLSPTRNNVKSI